MEDTPVPTAPRSSSTVRLRKRIRKRAPGSVKNTWLITATVLVFLAGAAWSVGIRSIAAFLYEPAAVIILVLLLLEYIVLKGRDRSRIYRIELEKLRDKRHQDIEFLRELETAIADLESELAALAPALPDAAARTGLDAARERIVALRATLARNL